MGREKSWYSRTLVTFFQPLENVHSLSLTRSGATNLIRLFLYIADYRS